MNANASRFVLCFALTMLSSPTFAAEPAFTVNLWPGLPPGDKPDMGKEEWQGMTLRGVVTIPTLAVYKPAKEIDTGAAVIVAPGGGFFQLSMGHEGADVATWLNSIGVTGIVLKYRIPQREGMPRYMAGFQDGQRAMSVVRSKAKEWGIDPKRIGMLGFSAGGQVTADVMTNFDKHMYEPVDEMDKAETRPDFAILIYPGGIARRNSEVPALNEDVKISKDTPPTFLSISHDDRGGAEQAVYTYLLLKRAGVPAELHVWGEGGHGYGIRPSNAPHGNWPERAAAWMRHRGYLNATPTTRPAGN